MDNSGARCVRIHIAVGRGRFAGLLALALTFGTAAELGSETMTLTTYYPSPAGVYKNLTSTRDTVLARDGGKVGIGTRTPAAMLDVAGGIRPGSSGVAIGGACGAANPEGTIAYDATAQVPVYCGRNGAWAPVGDNRWYVSWNSNVCSAGFSTLYSGSIFTSAVLDAGSPAADQLCTEGVARGRYRVNDALTTYQWDPPASCALCAKSTARFCFTHWGSAGCPAGFSVAAAGYMAQAAWAGGGSSGRITCWAGPRHGGLYVVNTTLTSYEWIAGDPCVECCN